MKRTIRILAALALVAGAERTAVAQSSASIRAAGMAGASMALARGHEALALNPANLGLPGRPGFSMALPRADVTGAIFGPSLGDVVDIFRAGDDLTDRQRTEFLEKVPAGGFELRTDVQVPWLAVSVGNFAFGATTTALIGGSVGKELIDLLLYVRQYEDVDQNRLNEYRVGNTAGRDALYTTVRAAYGKDVDLPFLSFPVSVGVGARYIVGHELQRLRIYEPRVDLNASEIYLTALAIRSTGGKGYGVDAGISARPLPWLTLGVAVDNVFQQMKWDEGIELRGDEFVGSELDDEDLDELYDRLNPRPFDPTAVPLEAYELARELFTEAYFPRVVRLGAGVQFGGTALGASFAAKQGKGDLHAGWPRTLAVGLEQRLPLLSFLTLRGGVASSLSGASAYSLGTTLRLGPVGISAAATATTGNDEAAAQNTFDGTRFAARLAAASGYGLTLGIEIGGF